MALFYSINKQKRKHQGKQCILRQNHKVYKRLDRGTHIEADTLEGHLFKPVKLQIPLPTKKTKQK
jgi:hypothetical protein